jgi:hypothetical protein
VDGAFWGGLTALISFTLSISMENYYEKTRACDFAAASLFPWFIFYLNRFCG